MYRPPVRSSPFWKNRCLVISVLVGALFILGGTLGYVCSRKDPAGFCLASTDAHGTVTGTVDVEQSSADGVEPSRAGAMTRTANVEQSRVGAVKRTDHVEKSELAKRVKQRSTHGLAQNVEERNGTVVAPANADDTMTPPALVEPSRTGDVEQGRAGDVEQGRAGDVEQGRAGDVEKGSADGSEESVEEEKGDPVDVDATMQVTDLKESSSSGQTLPIHSSNTDSSIDGSQTDLRIDDEAEVLAGIEADEAGMSGAQPTVASNAGGDTTTRVEQSGQTGGCSVVFKGDSHRSFKAGDVIVPPQIKCPDGRPLVQFTMRCKGPEIQWYKIGGRGDVILGPNQTLEEWMISEACVGSKNAGCTQG
eukprot:868873_1